MPNEDFPFIQRIFQRKRLTTHAMVAWEFIVKRDKLLLNPLAYFTPFADLTNLMKDFKITMKMIGDGL